MDKERQARCRCTQISNSSSCNHWGRKASEHSHKH